MLRHRSSTVSKNIKILTWVIFVFTSLIYTSHSAEAAIYAGPQTGWLIVSSHSTLLDACRNNPLARNFTRKLSKTRAALVSSGLAAPSLAAGQLLIGFATSPNEVALDGETRNSPFTAALLRHMETPGLEIELMLKRVKSDVFEETGGNQSPWNNSALSREFYFVK